MRELEQRGDAPPPLVIDTAGIGARLREAGHGGGLRRAPKPRMSRRIGATKSARLALGSGAEPESADDLTLASWGEQGGETHGIDGMDGR